MEKQSVKVMQIYLGVISVLGWFALIAQFYININSKAASVPEIVIRYFSYFTLLTNLLVAVCCSFLLLRPGFRRGIFSGETILTAITVYITIVGIVYNIILRNLWHPEGLQLVVDELLHSVIPVLFLLYWLIFVPKGLLQWKNVFSWLIYPVVYIVFVLLRGTSSGFYPYPFINVNDLGYSKVLLNCCGLFIAFLLLSLLFIAIAKMMNRAR